MILPLFSPSGAAGAAAGITGSQDPTAQAPLNNIFGTPVTQDSTSPADTIGALFGGALNFVSDRFESREQQKALREERAFELEKLQQQNSFNVGTPTSANLIVIGGAILVVILLLFVRR